ncbi:MAG: caspase family protein, partial [Treponema sp.]|nr:caspase family protein [Treponema sp.]
MKRALFFFLLCWGVILMAFGASGTAATRRFGIFVGSNEGGWGRITLRYAVSDARALSRVFTEMGGIDPADSVLLVEPNKGELKRHIGALRERVMGVREAHKRTEIVFYYSGHSDEEGLLLGRERCGYRELREEINSIPSDMRIVILDSCSSGAFTRAKGGVKAQPFLFDNSMSAEGYAFLTSSSATEASQESDALGGSYFTHNLLAGLRGAADTVGDGRITLNELYRYAYAETLARTEMSRYGPQHPSYDMRMSGTGDMVLTDLRETSAGLVLHEDLSGRLSIRDASDYLAVEINKALGKPMELGLEPGPYRMILQRGDVFSRMEITLTGENHTLVGPADFRLLAAAPAAPPGAGETEAPVKPVNIQLAPGLGFIGFDQRANNYVFFAILSGLGYNLKGFGLAGFGLSNTGFVRGFQFSGIYHTVRRNMYGLEAAGIFNLVVEDVRGAQLGGITNITLGTMYGMQLGGIANIAGGNFRGLQMGGITNVTAGDLRGVQLGAIANVAAGSFRGFQMGLVNYTGGGEGGGVMAGLVNVSQNENVIPIGLVNVVKNG